MTYMALGKSKKVELLCEIHNTFANGAIEFHVINGGWWGRYFPWNGMMEVLRTREGPLMHARSVQVLWRGETYKGSDYNDAIYWVQDRIENPWKHRLNMILDFFRNLHRYRLVVRVEKMPETKKFNGYENDLDDEVPF